MKKVVIFIVIVAISCSQLVKESTQKKYDSIFKNLTNAESMGNPVQKEKLLNRSYNLLMQWQTELAKEKKTDVVVSSLFAYYYYLKGNYAEAQNHIDLAKSLSYDNPQVRIMQARLLLATKGKAAVSEAFELLNIQDGSESPMGYIAKGDAYYVKGDYTKAQTEYKNALLLNKELQVVAANRLEVIAKIKSLKITIEKVSDIILQPTITREKLAYAMYDVFGLQKYIVAQKNLDANFIDLEKSHHASCITQLRNHGFFSYIQGSMFEPFMVVTRGEMAKIIEDFVVLSKNNERLRSKFQNETPSYFNDVKADNLYYNALRLAVDLDIMSVSLSQDAYPDESVSGLEAFMILQKLIK